MTCGSEYRFRRRAAVVPLATYAVEAFTRYKLVTFSVADAVPISTQARSCSIGSVGRTPLPPVQKSRSQGGRSGGGSRDEGIQHGDATLVVDNALRHGFSDCLSGYSRVVVGAVSEIQNEILCSRHVFTGRRSSGQSSTWSVLMVSIFTRSELGS